MSVEILNKIIPNTEIEISLSNQYLNKLVFFENETGKWYLKSYDSGETNKLVFNENNGKTYPEEIIRQLFILELIEKYGFPKSRIKIEQQINFGREKKRADVIVYQNDNETPLILAEIKAPFEKNNPQQLKSYLNAEGSPIGVGFNGKNISRYIRPYPKEFDTISDLPFEFEYQTAKNATNLIGKIKDLIASRKWTLPELTKLNQEKQYDLKSIIEELEELVLANSGVDSFDEIFKLIYAKLFDEFEAENRSNQTLFFRDYSNAKITHEQISKLFEQAKNEWQDVFEPSDRIKLTPEHLEIVIGKLTEVKLYGANLRIIDEAFEYLVPAVAKASKGQYFTPRVVIDNCVKMLNPGRKEYVLDPACGSAGFLLHTMEYVWNRNNLKTYKQKSDYAGKYLWGIDFEERTTKISRALMLIAGDGKTHIYKENTLEYAKWDNTFRSDLMKMKLLTDQTAKNLQFDIIMSNPPFAGDIKEKAIINQYFDLLGLRYSFKLDSINIKSILQSLSKDYSVTFTEGIEELLKTAIKAINKDDDIDLENEDDVSEIITQLCGIIKSNTLTGKLSQQLPSRLKELLKFKKSNSTWDVVERHILFIERIIDMLKEGGRAVIVLPQGIFNNANEKYVRRYINQKARILGVVGLHGNSFKPHTGTKTSLMFLRKYTQQEIVEHKDKINHPIFFATSKISFKDNSGRYVYVKDIDGNTVFDKYTGNQIYLTDLYNIAEAFKDWGLMHFHNGDTMFEFLTNN